MTKTKDEQQEHLESDLLSFINVKFIAPIKINGTKPTVRQYEEITSIGRTTIEKLTKSQGYDVPISTISKICQYANISLSNFFSMFEDYREKERYIKR
jgi:DNA-binding Xre family transcriptional regulator